jgi:hypothetical protein
VEVFERESINPGVYPERTLVALASSSDMGRIVRWRLTEAPVSVPSLLEDAAGDDARERLAKAPARRRCFCSVICAACSCRCISS